MRLNSRKIQSLRLLCFILVILSFVQCDKDDDFVYPNVLTDFMDIYTNENKLVDRIQADGSQLLFLNNILQGENLQSDTLYRAVGMYSLPDESGHTSVYNVSLIYAGKPHKRENITAIKTDPLNIESVYRGGNYLNIVALPMMQNNVHSYAFVEDSIRFDRLGKKKLFLKLAHNQNGDRESFPRRVYLSIPLGEYDMNEGDTVILRANIYNKGEQAWQVAY